MMKIEQEQTNKWTGKDGKFTCEIWKMAPDNVYHEDGRQNFQWYLYYDGKYYRNGKAATHAKAVEAINRIVSDIRSTPHFKIV